MAAVESALEGIALREEQSYQLDMGGKMRNLQFVPRAELIQMRNYYKNEVRAEEQAERIANGLSGGSQILVRFKAP